MSKLTSNDGISCDLCNLQFKNEFVYYNYDLVKTYIVNKFQPSIFNIQRKPELQVDVCSNCNSLFTDRVVKNNINKTKMAFCELTGILLDDGPAYVVFVSEINVNIYKKSVKTDYNYLSFVMNITEKQKFINSKVANNSWGTKS